MCMYIYIYTYTLYITVCVYTHTRGADRVSARDPIQSFICTR